MYSVWGGMTFYQNVVVPLLIYRENVHVTIGALGKCIKSALTEKKMINEAEYKEVYKQLWEKVNSVRPRSVELVTEYDIWKDMEEYTGDKDLYDWIRAAPSVEWAAEQLSSTLADISSGTPTSWSDYLSEYSKDLEEIRKARLAEARKTMGQFWTMRRSRLVDDDETVETGKKYFGELRYSEYEALVKWMPEQKICESSEATAKDALPSKEDAKMGDVVEVDPGYQTPDKSMRDASDAFKSLDFSKIAPGGSKSGAKKRSASSLPQKGSKSQKSSESSGPADVPSSSAAAKAGEGEDDALLEELGEILEVESEREATAEKPVKKRDRKALSVKPPERSRPRFDAKKFQWTDISKIGAEYSGKPNMEKFNQGISSIKAVLKAQPTLEKKVRGFMRKFPTEDLHEKDVTMYLFTVALIKIGAPNIDLNGLIKDAKEGKKTEMVIRTYNKSYVTFIEELSKTWVDCFDSPSEGLMKNKTFMAIDKLDGLNKFEEWNENINWKYTYVRAKNEALIDEERKELLEKNPARRVNNALGNKLITIKTNTLRKYEPKKYVQSKVIPQTLKYVVPERPEEEKKAGGKPIQEEKISDDDDYKIDNGQVEVEPEEIEFEGGDHDMEAEDGAGTEQSGRGINY